VGTARGVEHLSVSNVYIIIVNWNSWKDTIECLESLLLLEYPFYRVLICDNGSSDDSVAKLRQWFERTDSRFIAWQELTRTKAEKGNGSPDAMFTLITNGTNLGFGGGTNVGLRYALACADADFCWLLNNDTVVDAQALSTLVERLQEKPNAGMCGSTIRDYEHCSKIQALGGAVYYRWIGVAWHIGRTQVGEIDDDPTLVENKMNYVVGASLLVRTSYLRDIGLMAEDYFLFFEEIDWVTRGKDRYSLAYAPRSIVYHKVGASIGTATNPRRKSYQCDYYTLRNRLVFTRRYYPYSLVGVYAFLIVELFARVLVGRWDLAGMICGLLRNGGTEAEMP
jgi:GT2 family glycosyltransferase